MHRGQADAHQARHQDGHVKHADDGLHVNQETRDRYHRADVTIPERGQRDKTVIRHVGEVFIPDELLETIECTGHRLGTTRTR